MGVEGWGWWERGRKGKGWERDENGGETREWGNYWVGRVVLVGKGEKGEGVGIGQQYRGDNVVGTVLRRHGWGGRVGRGVGLGGHRATRKGDQCGGGHVGEGGLGLA